VEIVRHESDIMYGTKVYPRLQGVLGKHNQAGAANPNIATWKLDRCIKVHVDFFA
jgi:hypothetical protein